MKEGKQLSALAEELVRQAKSKKDYLADTRSLLLLDDGGSLRLKDNGDFSVSELCHNQIAERLEIPARYYQRMRIEAAALLTANVNHWFSANPETRLIRTLDGRVRAFLSDRYRPLDNFDLSEAVLPKINEMRCEIKSAELTETRLYLKAVAPHVQMEVKVGDIVQAGLVVSNSEVGCGSVRIEPLVYRLVCRNGMIVADQGIRKFHLGKIGEEFEGAKEFFKDETLQANDKAFWLSVRDVVEGALNLSGFRRTVQKLREAADRKMEGNPAKSVEVLSGRFAFTDTEKDSVLRHLIEGRDLSQYGLSNAVARASQEMPDYDRATEFERIGGQIIELPKPAWMEIANAN